MTPSLTPEAQAIANQTYLNFNEMPISFTGQALLKGTHSDYLNPINKGQGSLNRFVGKPVRFISRAIYTIAARILSPFGILYHLSMSACTKIQGVYSGDIKKSVLAWEHLKAAGNDVLSLILPIVVYDVLAFAVAPNALAPRYISSSDIQISNLTATAYYGAIRDLKAQNIPESPKHKELRMHMEMGLFKFDGCHSSMIKEREVNGKLEKDPIANSLGIEYNTYLNVRRIYIRDSYLGARYFK